MLLVGSLLSAGSSAGAGVLVKGAALSCLMSSLPIACVTCGVIAFTAGASSITAGLWSKCSLQICEPAGRVGERGESFIHEKNGDSSVYVDKECKELEQLFPTPNWYRKLPFFTAIVKVWGNNTERREQPSVSSESNDVGGSAPVSRGQPAGGEVHPPNRGQDGPPPQMIALPGAVLAESLIKMKTKKDSRC